MSRKFTLLAYLLSAVAPVLLTTQQPASAADEQFTATAAITLPNGQKIRSFDISFVDPVLGLYVLADRTNKAVDVVDTHNNTTSQLGAGLFVGFTGNNDTSGPDGVLIVDHRDVWAGDGNSTFKVIDLFTNTVTATVSTGGVNRVDEMCLDPRNHLVLMANNAESPRPFATLVSTHQPVSAASIVKKITFDGTNNTPIATNGAEQCQWSPRTGKFYIAIPEVNGPGDNTAAGGVAVINSHGQVETTFIIDHEKCAGPQGMAIGPDHQILLGCNAPSGKKTAADTVGNGKFRTVVIDERNGHIIRAFDNESGADEVWFNPGNGHYFLARSAADGPTQLLGVIDAEALKEDASVFTSNKGTIPGTNPPLAVANAHSVAADPVTNKTFVPIGFGSGTVCSSAGGNDALGCIAVFTAPKDRDDCVAEGAPVIEVKDDGDSRFHRGECGPDHDHDHR